MSPPAQPGGTPHGAPPWRCRPRSRLRPVAGSGAKAPRHQAFLPGCGAGLFVSAVTSRGRRHIPLRLQDRLAKAPLDEQDIGVVALARDVVNIIFITYS